jgi:hypothetical protein
MLYPRVEGTIFSVQGVERYLFQRIKDGSTDGKKGKGSEKEKAGKQD